MFIFIAPAVFEKPFLWKKLATITGLRIANLEQFTRTNKRLIATVKG